MATFFLKFFDKEMESDFRKKIRQFNSKTYKVFVIEKPNGVFELQKWLPDSEGLSTYLKVYSVLGKTSESEECDALWNSLFQEYCSSELKNKVVCALKEFDCEKQFREVANKLKPNSEEVTADNSPKVTQFPNKETA